MVTVSQARDGFRWKCCQANHTRFEKQKTNKNLLLLKETTSNETRYIGGDSKPSLEWFSLQMLSSKSHSIREAENKK